MPLRLARSVAILSSVFLVTLAARVAAQELPTARPEEVGVSPTKVEGLSTFMQSLVDQGQIAGGVTMMARHGKVIHLKAVGMADREEKKPMQTDAIFRIASMTKPITSVAIMKLWEEGKLGLDDPLSQYIPEFKSPQVLVSVDPLKAEPAKREITIRHLLTHTSGLGYPFSEKVGPLYEQNGIYGGVCSVKLSLEEMMPKLARMPLLCNPGDQWNYSISTDVLGRVVEVVSGMRLDRFIEDRICAPLGMKDTSFHVSTDKLPRLVSAYISLDGKLRKVEPGETLKHRLWGGPVTISSDYPYDKSNNYLSGGGSLCSTVSDFAKFCQMLLNRGQLNDVRLLREETVRMMTTNQLGQLPGSYGFGFGIMTDAEDVHEQLRGFYSGGGYWSTTFGISPRGDWILVTMSQLAYNENLTPAWTAHYEKIAAEAIQQPLDTSVAQEQASPSSSEQDHTKEFFNAFGPPEGREYMGTMTVDDKTVEIRKVQMKSSAFCSADCYLNLSKLELAFTFTDASFRLPGTTSLQRSFPPRFNPRQSDTRFYVQSGFHGVVADLTYGEELTLTCRTTEKGDEATRYIGIVTYHSDNSGRKGQPTSGSFEVVCRGGKIEGVISGEKMPKIRFSLSRIAEVKGGDGK